MTHERTVALGPRSRRMIQQLFVLLPPILASLILSQRGVPPLRRLITSAVLGLILIVLTAAWRVVRMPRSQRS